MFLKTSRLPKLNITTHLLIKIAFVESNQTPNVLGTEDRRKVGRPFDEMGGQGGPGC